jgi:hypothetical protein
MRMRLRSRIILISISLVIVLLMVSCTVISRSVSNLDSQFDSLSKPYSFNFIAWEFDTLFTQLKQRVFNQPAAAALNTEAVTRYFSYMSQIDTLKTDLNSIYAGKFQADQVSYSNRLKEIEARRDALQSTVEQAISEQITETLALLGIYNPLNDNWLKLTFPPVNFKLEEPLYVLIISPRDKIEKSKSITIKQGISLDEIEDLESSIDRLNVSSLVVEIGGLGSTYPTFVIDNADLRWTIDTAVHEWLHQYLAFKPLGLGYILNLLGMSSNTAVATINETTASMIGKEIGALVYEKYYAQNQPGSDIVRSPETSAFDFNAEMRNIRTVVDNYLAQGQIDQAESFMKQKQQFLDSNGYYIRKLNQAYFAFYGSYADSPTSVDPIGEKLKLLRKQSDSVADFLSIVCSITNVKELDAAIAKSGE